MLQVTSFDSRAGGTCCAENIDDMVDVMTNENIKNSFRKKIIKECHVSFVNSVVSVFELAAYEEEVSKLASLSGIVTVFGIRIKKPYEGVTSLYSKITPP